ncbi:hypothetical protein LINPERPRIM_LOCUS39532 [Linum perenne]
MGLTFLKNLGLSDDEKTFVEVCIIIICCFIGIGCVRACGCKSGGDGCDGGE